MSSIKDVKGRYVLPVWLAVIYLFSLEPFMRLVNYPYYWWDIGYFVALDTAMFVFLVVIGNWARVNWREFFGGPPSNELAIGTALLFIFLWIMTIGVNYLTFYPLSLWAPDFVTWWYIYYPPVVYTDGLVILATPTLLSVAQLVILAPLVEETLFRGFLLHRWAHKWGIRKAILLSSLAFGVYHPDFISATIFGIAMCIVYLRSQSLVTTILLHAAWNATYCGLEYYDVRTNGMDYLYSLEDFQSDWPFGLLCLSVAVVWGFAYIAKTRTGKIWRLPSA